MRSLICLWFIVFYAPVSWAQFKHALDATKCVCPTELLPSLEDAQARYSTTEWKRKSNEWQINAIKAGYFLFEIRPTQLTDSIHFYALHCGPHFNGIHLRLDANQTSVYSSQELSNLVQDSLQARLNSGFPFASVSLHFTSGKEAVFQIEINPGPYVTWGELHVKPENIIKDKALTRLLVFQTGAPYQEQELVQLQQQVAGQLPFKLLRAPEWSYQNEVADVYLYLERVKASSAAGILGLQQNPTNLKTALVGELNVQLQNFWQKNEKLLFHWRSIAPQTQQLKTSLQWPYIAGSAYGLTTGFSLYRRDTSFLEVKANLGLTYLLAKQWQLFTQVDYWQSNRLSQVPQTNLNQNFSTFSYGLGLERQQLDFLANPRKGMQFKAFYTVGNKQAQVPMLTWRMEVAQRYFLPLSKRQVLSLSQQFNHIQSATLYQNELYRFGGLERMRGFDEDAFFASTIAFASLEYRFLLDEYAHFLVFTDWSWLANKVQAPAAQTIYALGLGLSIGSESGQFKLSYGLGTQLGQAFQLNAGKLHVGYISYF